MPNRYFDKFPEVNYNGFNVKNITTSAMLVNKYVNVPYKYSQYAIDHDQRTDNVAQDVYDDPYMTWMIFYANKIIDPYYDWYLNDDEFNSFIIEKYGSLDIAQRKIKFFIDNWFNDSQQLTQSEFDKRFGNYKGFHSNYWQPNYDENSGRLISFTRKPNDYTIRSNKLIKIEVNDSTDFAVDDLITIKIATNGTSVGTAEIEDIQDNFIILRNVLNDINNNYFIINDAGNNTQIINYSTGNDLMNDTWTSKLISDEEYVYWSPLSYYDYERELNEYKKTINIVEPFIATKVAESLKDELNG